MNRVRAEVKASAVGQVERLNAQTAKKLFRFGESFVGFQGHFPGNPILPAFVQMMMALSLVAEAFPVGHELSGVAAAKFHLPIRPHDEIQVECRDLEEGQQGRYRIRLTVADRVASVFDLITAPRGSV